MSEDSDVDIEVEILKKLCRSLDGLDVSIDGVDIPLFFNSLDIFADVELSQL